MPTLTPKLRIIIVLIGGEVALGLAGGGFSSAPSAQAPNQLIFSTRQELVVLNVTVKEKSGSDVSDLTSDAFVISEDGQRQAMQIFTRQDAPVTVGLLLDSSGSMRAMRDRVIAAATSFAEASNPDDEIFALAFNETVREALPPNEPFTSNPDILGAALGATISARGRTALYDAIAAGLEHVAAGTRERRVLVVVSDGGDNASTTRFDEVLKRSQASNTVIYTIALVDPVELDANPKRLKALADVSGGEAFEPADVTHVADALREISRDIRSMYTIGYTSTNTTRDGRFRRIRVVAKAPDGRSLLVRTRKGYVVEER